MTFHPLKPFYLVCLLLIKSIGTAWGVAPQIEPIADAQVSQGIIYNASPTLSNSSNAGPINWSKAYGPDDVEIDPASGHVRWSIPSALPGESFHIGIKASNADGYHIESWIVHVGVPKVTYIGDGEAFTNIVSAISDSSNQLSGMTFVVRNGTYDGWLNAIRRNASTGIEQLPIEGNSSGYTTIMAEDPGQVTLTGTAATIEITSPSRSYGYLAVKGFFSKGGSIGATGIPTYNNCSAPTSCRPHHLKFIRNGVESDGNTPFTAFRSDYTLFENNYAFGGGRYKIAGYQGSNLVFRRNIARYDRSNNEMSEPKGTYSMYSVINFATNNNIAIDGDQEQFTTWGSRAGEYTCPTTNAGAKGSFARNIQLNSEYKFGNIDLQRDLCDAEISNVVAWDVRPLGILFQSRSPSWLNHATMGKVTSREDNALAQHYFNAWPSAHARGVTNSVLHDFDNSNPSNGMFYGMAKMPNVDLELELNPFEIYEYPFTQQDINNLHRSVDRYGIETVNITESPTSLNSGGNTTISTETISNHPPLWQRQSNPSGGLRYLVRIEPNSNLSAQGNDGGDLGATVMTFKGKSGTLWGEPGYDEETNIPMWPFPMEDLIKEKMADYSYTGPTYTGAPLSRVATGNTGVINGARGFAEAGQTLTHYIWNYLDNTAPPFNVNAVAQSGAALIMWDKPALIADISAYKVYDFNPTTKALSNPRTVNGNANSFIVTGLNADTTYHFAVTAIGPNKNSGENGGESSYSYPASVTIENSSDMTTPSISNQQPTDNTSNAPRNTAISFRLLDAGSGINATTLQMQVNGDAVTPSVSGSPSNYLVNYQPATAFDYGESVAVSIVVSDASGNPLSTAFSFTVEEDTTKPSISNLEPSNGSSNFAHLGLNAFNIYAIYALRPQWNIHQWQFIFWKYQRYWRNLHQFKQRRGRLAPER